MLTGIFSAYLHWSVTHYGLCVILYNYLSGWVTLSWDVKYLWCELVVLTCILLHLRKDRYIVIFFFSGTLHNGVLPCQWCGLSLIWVDPILTVHQQFSISPFVSQVVCEHFRGLLQSQVALIVPHDQRNGAILLKWEEKLEGNHSRPDSSVGKWLAYWIQSIFPSDHVSSIQSPSESLCDSLHFEAIHWHQEDIGFVGNVCTIKPSLFSTKPSDLIKVSLVLGVLQGCFGKNTFCIMYGIVQLLWQLSFLFFSSFYAYNSVVYLSDWQMWVGISVQYAAQVQIFAVANLLHLGSCHSLNFSVNFDTNKSDSCILLLLGLYFDCQCVFT